MYLRKISLVQIFVLYLLKQEATWNHLKPAGTTQKLPETTWIYLKPSI